MSKKIKFLGAVGTKTLIDLFKDDLRLKQDLLQFKEMPNVAVYVGRVVQYTGKTNTRFTHGHFYKSTGFTWDAVYPTLSGKTWLLTDVLPSLDEADYNTMYLVPNKYNELAGYVRGEEQFYEIGKSQSWKVTMNLPTWEESRADVLYLVQDDNHLQGYVKDVNIEGKFIKLSTRNYNELENTPTINGISTQNISDTDTAKDVILTAKVKKYTNSSYDDDGVDIPVNELEFHAFKDEEIATMFGGD